ncbi:MAG: DUF4190 domain-containing protein [Actinobacteria bacterium]|nr:DUF4190 domain-containing protein [Actinomycetota bacterium]
MSNNPPPAPPPAPPPSNYPQGSYGAAPQNGMGTAALVFGILQFFCLGIIGAILALIFGKIGMNKAEQGLATNGGVAKAGFILGIIGVILSIIGIIVWIVIISTGGVSYEYNIN